MSALSHKLLDLYNTVKDSDDSHGRVMSTPFMKLPLKSVSNCDDNLVLCTYCIFFISDCTCLFLVKALIIYRIFSGIFIHVYKTANTYMVY